MTIDPIELSQKLIRCPSITPEDAGSLAVLEEELTQLGFVCRRMKYSEEGTADVDNLYAKWGDKSPNLCFAGHTDVVAIGNIEEWSVDPFAAEIIDGMLIGRGAVDMKPAIAAWISAISMTIDKIKGKGSLSLLITGDEEGVAINGTQKVLNQLVEEGEIIDACIVGEPTNPDRLGEMIKIGRRGSQCFILTVNGIQGHVAYPDLAHNPISDIVQILEKLVSHNFDNGTEFFQPSNLEITSIDVDNMTENVIPAEAVAKFNIRFNDIHSRDKLITIIREYCDSVTTQYTLDFVGGSEAFITKPAFLSKTISDSVKEITGLTPELSTTGGTSDARFIKNICPVVECGLINKTAHKVDEKIAIEDIVKLSEIYGKIIEKYFCIVT